MQKNDESVTSCPSSAEKKDKALPGTTSTTLKFYTGSPGVERTEGVIYLYTENQKTSLTEGGCHSEMICILAVPASMTLTYLLRFVAPVEPCLKNIKIIQDGTPNQYMVLLKFKSEEHATDFYSTVNNVAYNSFEPDICRLVYVANVETVKSCDGGSPPVSAWPVSNERCVICHETMDVSVKGIHGILTLLCNHSFHISCMFCWKGMTCPLCRHVLTPEIITNNKCFNCETQQSLWICLTCGQVCCFQNAGGHAYQHYQCYTDHIYCMQLENNQVWDHAGNNYVDHLVQNIDGKLVAIDEHDKGGNAVEDAVEEMSEEPVRNFQDQIFQTRDTVMYSEMNVLEKTFREIGRGAFCRYLRLPRMKVESSRKIEHMQSLYSMVTKKLDFKLAQETSDMQDQQRDQEDWQKKVKDVEVAFRKKDQEISDLQDQLSDQEDWRKRVIDLELELGKKKIDDMHNQLSDKEDCQKRVKDLELELGKKDQEISDMLSDKEDCQKRVKDLELELGKKDQKISDVQDLQRDLMSHIGGEQAVARCSAARQQEIRGGQIGIKPKGSASDKTGKKSRGKKR